MYKEYVMSDDDIKKFTKDVQLYTYNGDVEIFKQLVFDGYYSQYLVSTYGRVISTEYRGIVGQSVMLKLKTTSAGYFNMMLIINGERKTLLAHRLVAMMFIPNPDPENFVQINHIDGNKKNNHISNLEWCDSAHNMHHMYSTGLKTHFLKGEEITNSKYKESQINQVCKLLEEAKLSLRSISDITGVSYEMIRMIKNHHSWNHISSKYNIDNYNKYYDDNKIVTDEMVHKVCWMLESNQYNLKEISERTGVGFREVVNILHKKDHKNISQLYNVDNYDSRSVNNLIRKGKVSI